MKIVLSITLILSLISSSIFASGKERLNKSIEEARIATKKTTIFLKNQQRDCLAYPESDGKKQALAYEKKLINEINTLNKKSNHAKALQTYLYLLQNHSIELNIYCESIELLNNTLQGTKVKYSIVRDEMEQIEKAQKDRRNDLIKHFAKFFIKNIDKIRLSKTRSLPIYDNPEDNRKNMNGVELYQRDNYFSWYYSIDEETNISIKQLSAIFETEPELRELLKKSVV